MKNKYGDFYKYCALPGMTGSSVMICFGIGGGASGLFMTAKSLSFFASNNLS